VAQRQRHKVAVLDVAAAVKPFEIDVRERQEVAL
jgi:hypothetical protein